MDNECFHFKTFKTWVEHKRCNFAGDLSGDYSGDLPHDPPVDLPGDPPGDPVSNPPGDPAGDPPGDPANNKSKLYNIIIFGQPDLTKWVIHVIIVKFDN